MSSRWQSSARARLGHAKSMADTQQLLRALVDKYEDTQRTLAKEESRSQEAFDRLLHDLKMYAPEPNLKYSTKCLLELRCKGPAARAREDLPRLVPAQALWRPRGSPTAGVPSCHPPQPCFIPTAPVFHPGARQAWQQLLALEELELSSKSGREPKTLRARRTRIFLK